MRRNSFLCRLPASMATRNRRARVHEDRFGSPVGAPLLGVRYSARHPARTRTLRLGLLGHFGGAFAPTTRTTREDGYPGLGQFDLAPSGCLPTSPGMHDFGEANQAGARWSLSRRPPACSPGVLALPPRCWHPAAKRRSRRRWGRLIASCRFRDTWTGLRRVVGGGRHPCRHAVHIWLGLPEPGGPARRNRIATRTQPGPNADLTRREPQLRPRDQAVDICTSSAWRNAR